MNCNLAATLSTFATPVSTLPIHTVSACGGFREMKNKKSRGGANATLRTKEGLRGRKDDPLDPMGRKEGLCEVWGRSSRAGRWSHVLGRQPAGVCREGETASESTL